MITVVHGDDITASRNYYFDLKKNSLGSTTFSGLTLTVTDLQQALSGGDLFGTKKDIYIEELLSKQKNSAVLSSLCFLISQSSQNIILWESKELTKKQLEPLGHATIKSFRIPATIFAFLDSLKPGNGKQLIELFHKTLHAKDAEFVLVMLQRQVRILLAVQSNGNISELTRLAPWQKSKLEKQAKLFTTDELISIHGKLFQLELDMKTGNLIMPLADSLDLLLLSL